MSPLRTVGLWAVSSGMLACFAEFGDFDASAAGAADAVDRDVPVAGAGGVAAGGVGGAEDVGGAGGVAIEMCTNGVDDDGDGLVDCADAYDCAGYFCAGVGLDEGWTGPIVLDPSGATACDAAYPAAGPAGLASFDGNPCACGCGPVQDRACSVTVAAYGNAACAAPATSAELMPPSTCHALSAPATVAVNASTAFQAGTCQPSVTGEAQLIAVQTCAPQAPAAAAGCGADEACLRPPAAGQLVCFYTAGEADCPVKLPTRVALFEDLRRAPACSASDCSCGLPQGGACVGSVELSSGGCGSGVVESIAPSGACQQLGATTDISTFAYDGVAEGGACEAVGESAPVRFGPVTTLCCTSSI